LVGSLFHDERDAPTSRPAGGLRCRVSARCDPTARHALDRDRRRLHEITPAQQFGLLGEVDVARPEGNQPSDDGCPDGHGDRGQDRRGTRGCRGVSHSSAQGLRTPARGRPPVIRAPDWVHPRRQEDQPSHAERLDAAGHVETLLRGSHQSSMPSDAWLALQADPMPPRALKLGLRRCTPGNPIVGALWRRRLSQVRIERRRDLAGLDPTKPRHPERSSLPARAPDRVVSPHLCRPCPGARRVERRRWVRWASPHASTIGVGANESVEWIQGPDRDPAISSTRFVSSSIVSGFVMTASAPRARHRS
jgi:hypothetical protein